MNTYTPRKKKIHGPSVVGAMKTVKIDFRTEIMVPAHIPDEEARNKFLERISRAIKPCYVPATPIKEIPIGDFEDLEALAEVVEAQTEELSEEE